MGFEPMTFRLQAKNTNFFASTQNKLQHKYILQFWWG